MSLFILLLSALLTSSIVPCDALEALYSDFRTVLYTSGGNNAKIGYHQFVELFGLHQPPGWNIDTLLGELLDGSAKQIPNKHDGLPSLSTLHKRLFSLFDTNKNQSLNFVEYVLGLDCLYHGPNSKRLRCTFYSLWTKNTKFTLP